MSIRSASVLRVMPVNRHISLLFSIFPVLRIKVAPAHLGLHIHSLPIRPFHTTIPNHQQQQQPQLKSTPSNEPSTHAPLPIPSPSSPPPQSRAFTDEEIEKIVPNFSTFSFDEKMAHLVQLQALLATGEQKNDPTWKPGAYEAMTQGLAMKEQELRGKDTWYKKMFRSIAWGPTILVNAVLMMFWG